MPAHATARNTNLFVASGDGFLAALTCNPLTFRRTKYLPLIWGDEMITEDAFTAQPILQDFLSLIARHKSRHCPHLTVRALAFTPLLLADGKGEYPGNDWANGFMRGMSFSRAGLDRSLGRRGPCAFSGTQFSLWYTSMIPISRCVHIQSLSARGG